MGDYGRMNKQSVEQVGTSGYVGGKVGRLARVTAVGDGVGGAKSVRLGGNGGHVGICDVGVGDLQVVNGDGTVRGAA